MQETFGSPFTNTLALQQNRYSVNNIHSDRAIIRVYRYNRPATTKKITGNSKFDTNDNKKQLQPVKAKVKS